MQYVKVLLKFILIVFYLKNSYIFVLNKQIKKNIMKKDLGDLVMALLFMCLILTVTVLILNNF